MTKMTKEEALAKIEELKKYVEEPQEEIKSVGVAILSRYKNGILFQSSKPTIKEAVAEAIVSDANLSGADLSYADLSYADLSCANLSYADLSCADLSDANLSGADFRRADLSGANLSGANLRGADLSGAELHRTKFYGKGGTIVLKRNQLSDFLGALGFVIED